MNAATIDSKGGIEPQRAVQDGPQLRTILLTDLVDSTALVERLGDSAAAELFRAHDRLVLGLQQHWRGRLIDRSDGMLLLFERPIDGLGFALDYNRGLLELGAPHGVELKARAGLHVGEVLTWRNSEESVRVGAKPVEVEGLAKPMAGRLMTMARPGQILLSAVAEPLAHRAARELGERGQHLLWKSHGRWRFKGVPQAQQIFEVGEAGVAPLRTPPNTPKAWRDIPLWRRPIALSAEVAVVAVVAVGLWFITRPQPAIAFNERDWVVLADLRNLTGETLLDDSLEQAFRISLEQSRHVNVLSDLKTRGTLERMRLNEDAVIDRSIASEIAIRDGARAVILPTVAEVGGQVRVSAEVIDPHSQTTVYAEYADGKGTRSALRSIDSVVASLRGRLGEALDSVRRDSAPLPDVSTDSLEALRAYALGNQAFEQGDWKSALELYERAVKIDPEFALAHLATARVLVALSDRPAAQPYIDRAVQLRERLPPRDRLYLDAWVAEIRLPGQALARWKLLASLYPDYSPGLANTALALFRLNDFEAARPYTLAASVPTAPLRAFEIDKLGRIELALGHTDSAMEAFKQANTLIPSLSLRRQAAALAVQEQHGKAVAVIESIPSSGYASDDPIRYIDLVTLAVDRSDWVRARDKLREAQAVLKREESGLGREFALIDASVDLVSQPALLTQDRLMALADAHLEALDRPDSAKTKDDAFMALVAAYLAQRAGNTVVAERVLPRLARWEEPLENTVFAKMLDVVRAENERLRGDPEAAIHRLKSQLDGTELLQARVALRSALAAAGRHGDAREQSRWLLEHRGRAYMEANAAQVLQTLNVADTRLARLAGAESLVAMEQRDTAIQELKMLLDVWPRERLPDYLRRRVDAILPASKQ